MRAFIAALIAIGACASHTRAQDVGNSGPIDHLPDEGEADADVGGNKGDEGGKGPAATPESEMTAEQRDQKARERFLKGRAAFSEGEYRTAWDEFHAAYLLSKRPELLYNIGQTADRLRMDREALKSFRLYLKKLPDAQNRKEVEARIKVIEDRLEREEQLALVGSEPVDDGSLEDDDNAPAAPPSGDQPTREGWYARAALGFGGLSSHASTTAADATLTSGTLAAQLGLGYGVVDGLAVGGAAFFEWAAAPKVDGNEIDSASAFMLGPFVDWYLDPHEDGWHLQGALAIAWLNKTDTTALTGADDPSGLALILGGGYEWRIDEQWGLGILGRLTIAGLQDDVFDHRLGALSVMCSATMY
jgi:hypothetical protein